MRQRLFVQLSKAGSRNAFRPSNLLELAVGFCEQAPSSEEYREGSLLLDGRSRETIMPRVRATQTFERNLAPMAGHALIGIVALHDQFHFGDVANLEFLSYLDRQTYRGAIVKLNLTA